MHSHPGVLAQINGKDGYYVAQVVGNQPILSEDLAFQEQVSCCKSSL
ncbi:MAG: hypothetical protein AAF632_29655 [Bacteroidota bacterium]